MKNKQNKCAKGRSLLAIIAIAAVIGFWVTACDNGGGASDTAISIAAIEGVTAPASGETPVTAITPTAQYTGTVSWNGSPATFAESTAYTATITLTAKSGFTLQGVAADFFTVAGATVNNAANSGTVTAVFPATAAISGIATLQFTSVQVEKVTFTPHPVYGDLGLKIPSFSNYNGNLTLTNDQGGGTGSVTNGKFSFSIGTPNWTETMYGGDNKFGCSCDPDATEHDNTNNDHGMLDWLFVLWTPYTNVTASVPAAKGTTIYDFETSSGKVFKADETVSIAGNNITVANESVIYIYVDQDVTLTAQQATQPPDEDSPFPATYPALNLALKQGWNMVKRAYVTTVDTGANPPETMSGSQTSTFKLGDSHRWVFEEK